MIGIKPFLGAVALAVLVPAAGPAAAQASANVSSTTVFGGGMAEACSKAAKAAVKAKERARGPFRPVASMDGLTACDRALSGESLTQRDLAATHVNRGVLLMGAARYPAALEDYETALRIRPALAEGHANRGAALVALGRNSEGVEAITRGLELQTEQPEKSYYNRAIAREKLDDLKGAYLDYLKASELQPDWPDPQNQLARFTLTPK